MAGNIKKGKKRDLDYAKYASSGTQAANRKRKLERLLKEQPNNPQIAVALKNIQYRRGTPKDPQWLHSQIAIAKIMKYFTGKFDKAAFHPDLKISHGALQARNPQNFLNLKDNDTSNLSYFSLGRRAHDKFGNLAWG